jgi:hypothetical protein
MSTIRGLYFLHIMPIAFTVFAFRGMRIQTGDTHEALPFIRF